MPSAVGFLQRSRPMNEARLLLGDWTRRCSVCAASVVAWELTPVISAWRRRGPLKDKDFVMTRADREDQRVRRASLTRAG